MKINISDDDLEELIFTGRNAKYKKYSRDGRFMEGLARVYKIMQVVQTAEQLRLYSFLHYEKLSHTDGLSSVRVLNSKVERLIFREIDDGIEITILELNANHYGNKK